ncbi:AGAP005762-PB-like protein [Anopheles sinensis]|uniref:AGAP005762-PB-like protein n=1 Tax=Anopheles sinensis TaxID=74873 RepID=A0A084WJN2_ANOSI|nr:AGAP005762-PB-like protein [Anopheles sinensis]
MLLHGLDRSGDKLPFFAKGSKKPQSGWPEADGDLHENNLDVASIAAGGAMTLAAMTSNGTIIKANGVPVCDPQQQQQQQDHDRLQAEPMPSTSQQQPPGGSTATQPQIVVGTIELNNLNGDAVNIKEKEIGTSNQFETLTLIDEDDEEEKDRNCSNAHSSSSLLSSNNDNRSAEENNVHSAATLSISEQHARRKARRRSSSQKGRHSAEDIDSIDRADSAVDVTHVDEVPHTFEEEDAVERKQDGAETVILRKRKSKKRSQRRRPKVGTEAEATATGTPLDAVDGQRGEEDEEDDEEEEKKEPYDKAVTCLYWSLACWDCNIS